MKKGGRTMKKSKILVSTALALCMGATAVIPAFAAENQKFTSVSYTHLRFKQIDKLFL